MRHRPAAVNGGAGREYSRCRRVVLPMKYRSQAFGEHRPYGRVTIAKSVSIIAPPGIYAGVTVPSGGGDAIMISGNDIDVTLRGLTVNAPGANNGIHFANGSQLIVDRCTITSTGNGVLLSTTTPAMASFTRLRVEHSLIGVNVQDNVSATFADSVITQNVDGFRILPTGDANIAVEIDHTLVDHNLNDGVAAAAPAGFAIMLHVRAGRILDNGNEGIYAFGFPGGLSLVYATDDFIARNQDGIVQDAGSEFVRSNNVVSTNVGAGVVQNTPGNVFTMGDNVVRDNAGGNIVGGTLTPLTFN